MILELLVGLLIIGLLALTALFFTKGSRKDTNLPTERTRSADEGVEKPRNKANMDQPQEEFIAPEGAHANADQSKK